jgi:hypothetical protein
VSVIAPAGNVTVNVPEKILAILIMNSAVVPPLMT